MELWVIIALIVAFVVSVSIMGYLVLNVIASLLDAFFDFWLGPFFRGF